MTSKCVRVNKIFSSIHHPNNCCHRSYYYYHHQPHHYLNENVGINNTEVFLNIIIF